MGCANHGDHFSWQQVRRRVAGRDWTTGQVPFQFFLRDIRRSNGLSFQGFLCPTSGATYSLPTKYPSEKKSFQDTPKL